ncbi:hypothetical protein CDAR_570801 [Caerostris darwini]|uniref:Uncharacterized protein n=1 Tax=Caerostris darwini TaxID=1538125 RepID=A0AAV4QG41_9ARAC|nr:hypothetical protein CDAR_570801 [Caerostris darwini]
MSSELASEKYEPILKCTIRQAIHHHKMQRRNLGGGNSTQLNSACRPGRSRLLSPPLPTVGQFEFLATKNGPPSYTPIPEVEEWTRGAYFHLYPVKK